MLTPPDPKQCQVEKGAGSFMTFGVRPDPVRCSSKPKYLVCEIEARESDGEAGAMTICEDCFPVFISYNSARLGNYVIAEILSGESL